MTLTVDLFGEGRNCEKLARPASASLSDPRPGASLPSRSPMPARIEPSAAVDYSRSRFESSGWAGNLSGHLLRAGHGEERYGGLVGRKDS